MEGFKCIEAREIDIKTRWDKIIANSNNNLLVKIKDDAIKRIAENKGITYYGLLNNEVICEANIIIDASLIQKPEGLVDKKTCYLYSFTTENNYKDKGYFYELFKFIIEDLKNKHFYKITVGVDDEYLSIYYNYGFCEYIKTENEKYLDGTSRNISYYAKNL